MINYLIAALFILSVAITSGSIVIATQLKAAFNSAFLSSLIFFLVFFYTFGYYAIWGQLIIQFLLREMMSEEALRRITDIMILLGSPFLIMASLMFVKLTREITQRKISSAFMLVYLLINVTIVVGIGFASFKFSTVRTFTVVRYYFVVLNILYSILGIYYLLFVGKHKVVLHFRDLVNLALGILILMLLQNTLLILYESNIFATLLFILIFYLSGSFLPLYLRYKADRSGLILEEGESVSFEHFCIHYAISPREKEIILEICKGLSNQEIADRLFISLQTVKDHTHRIYGKTDCSSRAQLIRTVNDMEG